jgi:WhiB family transcriptional regulator, redox-sensing transcriptional regulator
LWFPVGDRPADPYAKATCDACPVSTQCLEWALANPKLASCGMRGGLLEGERRVLRRRRQRRGAAA